MCFLFINYNHILPESETVTAENLNKLSLMKSRALWIEVASKYLGYVCLNTITMNIYTYIYICM